MGKVQNLHAPQRSPAREALADAIAKLAALRQEGRDLAAAQRAAMTAVAQAHGAVEAAGERLTGAKADAVTQAVDAAMGRATEPALTVPAARRAITDAEDALEIARAARKGIEDRIAQNRTAISFATDSVKATALLVLRDAPGVAEAAARAEQAQREMVNATAALAWLRDKGVVEAPGIVVQRLHYLTQNGLGRQPEVWAGLAQDKTIPGEAPWRNALDALMQDADAPLPV